LVKGYQYGVTVDPVGISSLKKVRLWPVLDWVCLNNA
jgi:hypothetical protein